MLTSSGVANAGGAAGGGQDGHSVCVAELQSVSFLHSVVTRQQSEFHQLRQTSQQWLWKQKHNTVSNTNTHCSEFSMHYKIINMI